MAQRQLWAIFLFPPSFRTFPLTAELTGVERETVQIAHLLLGVQ
jgi:hypothetical protein